MIAIDRVGANGTVTEHLKKPGWNHTICGISLIGAETHPATGQSRACWNCKRKAGA